MSVLLKRVGIIGSGVMGSGIAAQLANAGVPSLVLDIVPTELTAEEQAAGLTLSDRKVRNRIAHSSVQLLLKSKPAQLFEPSLVQLIEVGNIEDDFARLAEVDWIIEAAPEKVAIKQSLFERLEGVFRPGQILSSNTSGISIKEMMAGRSKALQKQFMVTHFFNPPRYMRLLEIVPGPETDPGLLEKAAWIGTHILGKGIVYAKDTPNFIANRVGVAEIGRILNAVEEKGFTVEEVDGLTGKPIGRPKSGFFRLMDIVGLDTLVNNSKYLADKLSSDPTARVLRMPAFVQTMMEKNLRGEKTQAGFYKRVGSGADKEIHALNLKTFEYAPRQKVSFPSLETAKVIEDVRARVKAVAGSKDRGGEFVWDFLSATLVYSAEVATEISEDILNIDRAMQWGFNWELGPFELWDALGVESVAERLKAEGREVPALVRELLSAGCRSFYGVQNEVPTYYNFHSRRMEPIPPRPGVVDLVHVKTKSSAEILRNEVASLVDLGDGVVCFEFHSKMNTLSAEVVTLLHQTLDRADKEFEAILIANQGENFSAGANLVQLLLAAEEEDWDTIDQMIARFQNVSMRIKYFPKPIVACPHGLTLGGACEFSLHSHRIRAAAETYIGLVECGVGLIPGGAGTKEMAIRYREGIPDDTEVNALPLLQRTFELIGMAKVSGSAREGQVMGLLRDHDSWSMNKDCQIHDAKRLALAMVELGFRPPREKPVKVAGREGLAMIEVGLRNMQVAGYVSDYDVHLGKKLAYVLCGGDVAGGTEVSERYLVDIEREAFLHLCGQPKTQERIRYTLKTGKPLRN
ncbi:MAG: enoyl-CoA hydratase/isomerase family protein [Candidatus Omnitrophica bacterium]|nr:enoyl-CoA hydratase/isomerase family protein [Candidatus Omnitrophota bacterium]